MYLSSERLKRLEFLRLVWRRTGSRWIAPPRTRLLAGGAELTGHRDYSPGDPLWHVDWNLCARSDELLTRQFEGEADVHVYLFLDCSRSMALGEPSRFDVACRAAAAIGYCGLASGYRVGALAFADRVVADLAPLCGKGRVGRLLGFLQKLSPAHAPTNLAGAAAAFVGRSQRRGPVLVLSDVHAPDGFRQGLEMLCHSGYWPRVLWIGDPCEAEPLGDVELYDVETGCAREVTLTESDLSRYRQRHAAFVDSLRSFCASRAIPCVRIPLESAEKALEHGCP